MCRLPSALYYFVPAFAAAATANIQAAAVIACHQARHSLQHSDYQIFTAPTYPPAVADGAAAGAATFVAGLHQRFTPSPLLWFLPQLQVPLQLPAKQPLPSPLQLPLPT
jgi:hypothetical protein